MGNKKKKEDLHDMDRDNDLGICKSEIWDWWYKKIFYDLSC